MPKTLVIGYIMLDIKGEAPLNYAPRERNVGKISFCHGGVSRNVAENIANAGGEVTFATLCDRSGQGEEILSRLKNAGVNVAPKMLPSGGIGMWMVIGRAGETETFGQISYPPDKKALEDLIEERGEELISEADSIIVEIDASEKLSHRVFSIAEQKHIPVYTVVGNLAGILSHRDMIAHLDCFVCNDKEFARLTGTDLTAVSKEAMPDLLLKASEPLGCPSAVVTLGAEGSVYCDRRTGETGCCPSRTVTVIDATGAGDAFLTGLVMKKTEKKSLSEAVCFGTELACMALSTNESCIPPIRTQ